MHCFTSGGSDGGEYNCGRNEHGKGKQKVAEASNRALGRALS